MGMLRKNTPYFGQWLAETKYYCTLGGLALMVPATLGEHVMAAAFSRCPVKQLGC